MDNLHLPRRAMLAAGGAALLPRQARAQARIALSFLIWGSQAEQDAFRALIARYEALRPGTTIRLDVTGSAVQALQQLDTRLAGRQGPDVFRVQYQQVGRYAAAGAAIDVGAQLDASAAAAFTPALLAAVTYRGKPHAVPHHTDTQAVFCNLDLFRKIGVEPPTQLDASWSWADFLRIARQLKQQAGAPYGFAMGWQNAAWRFLPFVFQHGGAPLSADLKTSTMASREAAEAIGWCQSWFKEGLVPPSTSIKSNEQPQNLFAVGTVGMLVHGDWQIPFISQSETVKNWRVAPMPRDVGQAADLGGNALAVSRDSKNREAAIDFVRFATDEANMREFCLAAQFIPARIALTASPLAYPVRSDDMATFVRQFSTVPEALARTVTLPNFSKINAAYTDQLDLAFTSGQDAAATARSIDEAVQPLLG